MKPRSFTVLILLCLLIAIAFRHYNRNHDVNLSEEILRSADDRADNVYPPLQDKRLYHRCNYETIPYVSGALETVQYLLSHQNASFVRFGDGEYYLMTNQSLSFQDASEELSSGLFRSLLHNDDNFVIGVPDMFGGCSPVEKQALDYWYDHDEIRQFFLKYLTIGKQYFFASVSAPCMNTNNDYCLLTNKIYDTFRSIWMDKDIVLVRGNNGQVYYHDIYDSAASQTVMIVPKSQAWSHYRQIKDQLMKEDPSKLFILACGPMCKVLCYDLAVEGRRALDLGHLAKDYNMCKLNYHLTQDEFWHD